MKAFLVGLILDVLATSVWAQEPASPLPPGDSAPPTATDRIRKAGDAAKYKGAAYVIVLDSTVNRVNDQGSLAAACIHYTSC